MRSAYFRPEEFACKCCGVNNISDKLVELLDNMRENMGEPIAITSGYRCEWHNRAVGGVNGSAHTKGLAADIVVYGNSHRFKAISAALASGVKRMGIGDKYLHIDIDKNKPQNIAWLYGEKG